MHHNKYSSQSPNSIALQQYNPRFRTQQYKVNPQQKAVQCSSRAPTHSTQHQHRGLVCIFSEMKMLTCRKLAFLDAFGWVFWIKSFRLFRTIAGLWDVGWGGGRWTSPSKNRASRERHPTTAHGDWDASLYPATGKNFRMRRGREGAPEVCQWMTSFRAGLLGALWMGLRFGEDKNRYSLIWDAEHDGSIK